MLFTCKDLSPKVRGRLLVVALAICLGVIFYYYVSIAAIFTGTTDDGAASTTSAPVVKAKTTTRRPTVLMDGEERVTFTEADFHVRGQMGNLDVVTELREHFLVPPPPANVTYNFTDPDILDPSAVQAFLIERILRGKRNGFFVECGARDGEHGSNTLMFEREYNWTGLLIEPSPLAYSRLATKHRRAYISPTCLSRTIKQQTAMYTDEDLVEVESDPLARPSWLVRDNKMVTKAQVVGVDITTTALPTSAVPTADEAQKAKKNTTEVQCFPLYSYLLAVNRRVIDYLSLHVGGSELEVLKTIPWYRVDIRTLSVAFSSLGDDKVPLRAFMEGVGYYLHSEIKIGQDHNNDDYIFVKGILDL